MSTTSEKPIVRISEVMKKEFDTVNGMDTIETALKNMKYIENKCLIVNKRHEDDEYGVLLISDIGRKVLAIGKAPDRVNVYEVMAKPFISVDSKMDVRYCARLFDRFRITRAPVLDKGKVVGVVSFTDLVLKGLNIPG
ncbi:MAG: CBS domain-containing protein [Gammaproteobacteria bacterium]